MPGRKSHSIWKPAADFTVYLAVRVLVSLIQSLRLETCQQLAGAVALLCCDVLGVRRRVVEDNLRQVFPQLDAHQRRQVARAMWCHLLQMVCEIAHAPRKIHRNNWSRHLHLRGKQELVHYLLDPRPTVLVSGHFGNFEIGGYLTGLLGFPTHTVARTLDNPYLDRYVNRFRSANGQYIVPKDGSAGRIQEILQAGGTLLLLGDQHAGNKGCWVDFLGRPASCHKAIALFPLTTEAPLLVVYTRRTGPQLEFEAGLTGVADPARLDPALAGVVPLTQWYNARLEQIIRTAPQQYWWLHRRWKDPPRRRPKGRRAA